MVDSFRMLTRSDLVREPVNRCFRAGWLLLTLVWSAGVLLVEAQTPSAAAYPADPAATAGMTTSTSTGMSARDIQLMTVRTAAQSAQGDAAAAAMARSADRSLDEQQNARVLQNAREEKAIKREMRERMKWDRANAQVKKVSANDMESWRTQGGGVRVERNVPDPFIESLIEEERQIAAREAAEKKERGFSPVGASQAVITAPVNATRNALSRLPFGGGGRGAEPAATTSSSLPSGGGGDRGGFLSNLRPPRIGRGNDAPEPAPAAAEPQFVRTSASTNAPQGSTQATVTQPGMVPRISGAALVDGRSQVNQGSPGAAPSGNSQASFAPQPQPAASPHSLPGDSDSGGGFFSKLKPGGGSSGVGGGSSSRDSSGGGLFSFGKKKEAQPSGPSIEASLFPTQSMAQAPTGGSLSGGQTATDVAEDSVVAPSSTGTIELPGSSGEKKNRTFSLPKPKLSVPKISGGGGGSSGGGGVPTLTTRNNLGTDFYVVTSSAQFMIQGEDSEVRALPAGMVVQMTRPGENWASVRLSNGTEGILQNKNLRPASVSEASTQFTFAN